MIEQMIARLPEAWREVATLLAMPIVWIPRLVTCGWSPHGNDGSHLEDAAHACARGAATSNHAQSPVGLAPEADAR